MGGRGVCCVVLGAWYALSPRRTHLRLLWVFIFIVFPCRFFSVSLFWRLCSPSPLPLRTSPHLPTVRQHNANMLAHTRALAHTHTYTEQFGYRQQTTLAAWRPQNPLHKTRTSLMAAPRSQPRPNLLLLPSPSPVQLFLIYPSNRSDAVPGPSNTHMARLSSWQPIMGTHMRM